ncbi:hypothetical protein QJQ45_015090 [Haematococcus lacustris]|nr:hypothetical protein QJQ45_015090 [Haematococcus lacustris]
MQGYRLHSAEVDGQRIQCWKRDLELVDEHPQGQGTCCCQRSWHPSSADVVLAVDIVWLQELVEPLARTIAAILRQTSGVLAPVEGRDRDQGQDLGASSTVDAGAPALPPPGFQVRSKGKVALLAFGERATAKSKLFLHTSEVEQVFAQQGCAMQLLHRVVVARNDEVMPVVVLKVTL